MRTGVFGTRSPHRPCPIGLSLVQIDRIEGKATTITITSYVSISFLSLTIFDYSGGTIYFSGVDMVDQTPVLDLKPFIPQYDDPLYCEPSLM